MREAAAGWSVQEHEADFNTFLGKTSHEGCFCLLTICFGDKTKM